MKKGTDKMSAKTINKNQYFGYRSFMPEWETMKKFRAMGVDTFTMMFSNGLNLLGNPYTKYQPLWIWERKYDFSLADQQINDLLAAVPDAKILCYIDLNPPMWWVRRDGQVGKKFDSFMEAGKIIQSDLWREDVAHYFQALLSHLEKNFSEHVVGYIYSAGGTTEWFDRSLGAESIYRLQGFQKWRKEHGKTVPDNIPSFGLRYRGSHETDKLDEIYADYDADKEYDGAFVPTGLLRSPEKDELALDYWHYNNEIIADTVLYMAKKAREIIRPEVELGTMFGYILDFGFETLASLGHLEYERVFKSDDIDMIIAPTSYADRLMGGGSGSMIPMETLHLEGKRMLNTCDHATYTKRQMDQFPGSGAAWANAAEVEAGIKRETASNLISRSSTWWFDMWGGWWDSPEAMDTIAKSKKIWDYETKQDIEDVCEILIVQDPDNIYYVNDLRPDAEKFNRQIRVHLNRVGAPHVICSFNDLDKMDLNRFKLIVMCYPFELTAVKTEILEKYVYNSNHTVLWLYGPGIIKDGKWNPKNVKKVCGTTFKTPGINTVNMGEWQSVYVADPDDLNAENMHEIAKDAGVHIYSSKRRPVFANNRLLAVHTGEAETLTLTFAKKCRKIVELYTEKVYANTQSIELTTDGPKTFLFRYE